MTARSFSPGSVRASRDGHAYHEAWAARIALELLVPGATLTAVAMEGFPEEDEAGLSREAIEIADLVRYRGGRNVEEASSVEVVQFKYSIASADAPMRAADLGSTLRKFVAVDGGFARMVGAERVREVVRYEFATNRPFHADLLEAVDTLRLGRDPEGGAADQAVRIRDDTGLTGEALVRFAKRLNLTGKGGSLTAVAGTVGRRIAAWGGASDAIARLKLRELRGFVRDRAGEAGHSDNLVTREDMLGLFGLADERELFPTPDAFPKVQGVIERPIIDDLVAMIDEGGRPILVHGAAGMGKTVLLESLADRLRARDEVVLFDGFGGGRWRDPADARHLPKRAFLHIANTLAGRGLCDILLASAGADDLAQAFRGRLAQAVETIRGQDPGARIALILDAIDHAGLQADATRAESFAHVLLNSVSVNPIDGVVVVASCRTERIDVARGGARCRALGIPAFSRTELENVVRGRAPDVTGADLAALSVRSGGTPRCLNALLRDGRPYDGPAPGEGATDPNKILDGLLRNRIEDAIETAMKRGAREEDIHTFLAGLSLLPPPVPSAELAAAHGFSEHAVESFVADLSPLIERTSHGLIFKDEPTETLVGEMSADDVSAREGVVRRLRDRQNISHYAARALPGVLTALRRADELVSLAFDESVPEGSRTLVAQREIRLARLTAALSACAADRREDDLVRLMVEAARVAGGNERSDRFLSEYPDLAAVSDDAEAMRRLFETRVGWPGARHAALAVAHVFSGDRDEAARNGRRAFDWINWQSTQSRRMDFAGDRRNEELDRFGPAYVAVLNGRFSRVAQWIDQWPEDYAFGLFSEVMNMLERHVMVAREIAPSRDRAVERASRCRLKSRPLLAAALSHATRSTEQERRLIRRLADASRYAQPIEEQRNFGGREYGLVNALIWVAVRAAHLSMKTEAIAILDGVNLERPSLYDFDTSHPLDPTVERAVLAAGVRGAIDGRAPTLIDFLPREIVKELPAGSTRLTPKALEDEIERLLRPPKDHGARRKNQKIGKPGFDREKAKRVLTHRARPLLIYADQVASLINGAMSHRDLPGAFESLSEASDQARAYPYYDDGARFITRVGFHAFFWTADAVDAITAQAATHIINWLERPHLRRTPLLIEVISRLSMREDTHDAAMEFAGRVRSHIEEDTEIDLRISNFGLLARAIWRASPAEAGEYFRLGLDMADGVGSEDYEVSERLIALAQRYSGRPLADVDVLLFARICELSHPYEVDKFDWPRFGRAISRIGGIGSLALVARFDDRDWCRLELTLHPLLAALIDDGHLSPELAAILIGLDEPVEYWHWGVADTVGTILGKIIPDSREFLFSVILDEIDRKDGASPGWETINKMLTLGQEYLMRDSPCLARICRLHEEAARGRDDDATTKPLPSALSAPHDEAHLEAALQGVDSGNASAIDELLERIPTDDQQGNWPTVILGRLADQAQGPEERHRFVQALCETEIPDLSEKLLVLKDRIDGWVRQSLAIRNELPRQAIALAERHADELIGSNWEADSSLWRLVKLHGDPGAEIIIAIIKELRDRAKDVEGARWLDFTAVAAESASSESLRSALERFLRPIAQSLPDDIGDGPWRPELSAGSDDAEVVACMIWFRLGAADARARWRAAHAVRRLAEIGRDDILAAFVGKMETETAGAFQDQTAPFFFLHAKLWLLIALARIALDRPKTISPFRAALENVAFSTAFPHVLMRHFAAEALAALAVALEKPECDALLDRLDAVNRPELPRAPKKAGRYTHYDYWGSRPEGRPEPQPPFHFEYDFSKYPVAGVCRLFGSAQWDVQDACTRWIRNWSPDIEGMHDGPRSPYDFASWSSGRAPQRERWGQCLAWHALMLCAGEFLASRSVTEDSYSDDPWREWLDGEMLSRSDGLWLSDGTDPFLPELRHPLVPEKDNAPPVPRRPKDLAPLINLDESLALGDALVVDGWWSSSDGVDLSISSVLVDAKDTRAAALAILAMEPFFQSLPNEEDDEDEEIRQRQQAAIQIKRWILRPSIEASLDRYDPYGASSAQARPRPSSEIIEELSLRSDDPWDRCWRNEAGETVLLAEAWGNTKGEGRYERESLGARLTCRADALRNLLEPRNANLLVLVKAQKYMERNKGPGLDKFATRTLILAITPKGKARAFERVPRTVREAVERLHPHDATRFPAMLSLVKESLIKA